jgi:sodium-dependent dicarboxylate transporter 2/3/5
MSDTLLTLIVLALVSAGFIFQRLPLYITALAGALALAFLGVIPMASVYTSLANPTLILFAGMFVIGASLFHTGLAQLLGAWVVRRAGGDEVRLLWGIMAVTMVLSTFASNTGTAAALIPVIISMCQTAGVSPSKFLLPMAFTTGFAGFSTMVGTPPNLIVAEALRQAGHRPMGFFEFAWVCIPTALAGMAYMTWIGRKLLPENPAPTLAEDPRLKGWSVPVNRKRMWVSGGILLAVIAAMLLDADAAPLEGVALAGAVLCVVTGCLTGKQALASVDWETILLFGAMFAVAAAIDRSGAGAWVAHGILAVLGETPPGWLVVGTLFTVTLALGTFLSNTACAALLAPIALSLSNTLGADPHALLVTVAAASSLSFLTPMSTPPNSLVMNPGGYRFTDYLKAGGGLTVVCGGVAAAAILLRWPVFP